MFTHLAGCFFAPGYKALGRACEHGVWGHSVFLTETKPAGFRSRKLWNRQAKLYFMGIPIMRIKLATTAFKMPLYGISFPLSACPVSSTVFRNTEKLSCANEVSASKPEGSLLPDRSLSGHQLHSFSDFQGIDSLCLEKLYQSNFTAAKSNNGLSWLFLFVR